MGATVPTSVRVLEERSMPTTHRAARAVLLLGVLASACAAEGELAPPPPPPAPPPGPPAAVQPGPAAGGDAQRRAVSSFLAGFNAHDAKKLAEIYRPDAVVASPGPKGMEEVHGRDAIEKMHVSLFSAFPDIK